MVITIKKDSTKNIAYIYAQFFYDTKEDAKITGWSKKELTIWGCGKSARSNTTLTAPNSPELKDSPLKHKNIQIKQLKSIMFCIGYEIWSFLEWKPITKYIMKPKIMQVISYEIQ